MSSVKGDKMYKIDVGVKIGSLFWRFHGAAGWWMGRSDGWVVGLTEIIHAWRVGEGGMKWG